MPSKRKPLSPADQFKRFQETAREAGVDTSDKTLERIVREITTKTPPQKPGKPRRKKT